MYLALEVFQDLQRLEYRRCFQNPMILHFFKSASSSKKITILLNLVSQLFTQAKISIQLNVSKKGQCKEPTSEGIVEA
jgi:hypothetical protein